MAAVFFVSELAVSQGNAEIFMAPVTARHCVSLTDVVVKDVWMGSNFAK